MPTVTALEPERRKKEWLALFLDGGFGFGLPAELAVQRGLRVGTRLSEEEVAELRAQAERRRCLEAALRLLSYRPRSTAEMSQRLRRLRYSEPSVTEVIDTLTKQGFLDDEAFARYWRENRDRFSPRGRRLLRQELRQKGVDVGTIAAVTADADELSAALQAGVKRARALAGVDFPTFQRRLGGYLQRRGFGWDTIHEVVRLLWSEAASGASSAAEPPAFDFE